MGRSAPIYERTPRLTVIMPTTTKHSPGGQLAPDISIAPTCDPANPFIVQSDRSVLVEVDNPRYAEARDALAPFAELEKSPEHIHTYRISNLSLWNAAAAGFTAEQMVAVLQQLHQVSDSAEPAGRHRRDGLTLWPRARWSASNANQLKLVCADKPLLVELSRQKSLRSYLGEKIDDVSFAIEPAFRGVLKQALIGVGYPAEDLAGYTEGVALPLALRDVATSGQPFLVRDYQRDAADVFYAGGNVRGGSGVIVLPCGAGKTIVGIVAMALLQKSALDPDHEHHRREAVAARDPRQDRRSPKPT